MTKPKPILLQPHHRERLEKLEQRVSDASAAAHKRWALTVAVGSGGGLVAVAGQLLNNGQHLALLLPSAWGFAFGISAAGLAAFLEAFRLGILRQQVSRMITIGHDKGYSQMPGWTWLFDDAAPFIRDALLLAGGGLFSWSVLHPLWRVTAAGTL